MALVDQINEDVITSMKEGVVARVAVLRLIKSSLKNEQIKLGHELSDPEALKVVQREAKQRKDSITQYRDGGREDLATAEEAELAIIDTYLPRQMEASELADLVEAVIKETGATDMTQMGVVIGAVVQRAAGRADGAAVSQAVRQRLSQ